MNIGTYLYIFWVFQKMTKTQNVEKTLVRRLRHETPTIETNKGKSYNFGFHASRIRKLQQRLCWLLPSCQILEEIRAIVLLVQFFPFAHWYIWSFDIFKTGVSAWVSQMPISVSRPCRILVAGKMDNGWRWKQIHTLLRKDVSNQQALLSMIIIQVAICPSTRRTTSKRKTHNCGRTFERRHLKD